MRPSNSRPEAEILARPWREVGTEVLALSLFAVLFTGTFIWAVSGYRWDAILRALPSAGQDVLAQLGMGFGVYIPTLLGFYAIVAGGQLLGGEEAAAKTRRVLGFVAELMCAAMTPALTVLVVYVAVVQENLGTLLIVLPVTGLMFFLVIQLGGFVVPDPGLWVQSLEATEGILRIRLRGLRARSQRVLLVLIANVVLPTAAALVVIAAIEPTAARVLPTTAAIFGGLAAFYVATSWGLVSLSERATDRVSRAAPWVVLASLYVAAAIMADLIAQQSALTGWMWFLIPACALLSTVSGGQRVPKLLGDWTIRGAARRSAARYVVRSLRRTSATLRKVQVHVAQPSVLSGRDGFRARFFRLLPRTQPADAD